MGEIPPVLLLEGDLFTTAVGLALFGAVLPPLFYAAGAPLVSGGVANILTSVELPIAILSASILLSESVSLYQWFGIVIILVAIALNEIGPNLIRTRKRYLRQKTAKEPASK